MRQYVFILDELAALDLAKDTSIALIKAAQDEQVTCYYCRQEDLCARDNNIFAQIRTIVIASQGEPELGDPQWQDLSQMQAVFMRTDPPMDMNYVYTTYLLEQLEQRGVLIVNSPQGLRDFNEKASILHFPDSIPPTCITSDMAQLKAFISAQQDVILKPLDGMRGMSIFRVQPEQTNVNVTLELMTEDGRKKIMAQRYIPEVTQGDRRIIMLFGKPYPYALVRLANAGEHRNNIVFGGAYHADEITARERWICAQVGPVLEAKGLWFVGLDILGEYLTEINVTSPTLIKEINAAYDVDIGREFMRELAKR